VGPGDFSPEPWVTEQLSPWPVLQGKDRNQILIKLLYVSDPNLSSDLPGPGFLLRSEKKNYSSISLPGRNPHNLRHRLPGSWEDLPSLPGHLRRHLLPGRSSRSLLRSLVLGRSPGYAYTGSWNLRIEPSSLLHLPGNNNSRNSPGPQKIRALRRKR